MADDCVVRLPTNLNEEKAEWDFFRSTNKMQDSRLILAARRGQLTEIAVAFRRLEATHGRTVAVRCLSTHSNKLGKTALHECAQNGHLRSVEYLTRDVGVQVNCLKRGDWTPLMLACIGGHEPVVRCLMDAGADPYYRNKDGITAFHLACR
ncbi:unnamed protein product [Soboliphyme baturini]|uniref:ANK_REP_REGION domain-containing protein n=1 Tax=Soboliphyme baturini TaxID=241478 RepID=A0A183IWT4_9BILA|nr:unnamed protein product [Soboliphyme baturini]